MKPAVVLVSGGLDSATTAAVARREGFDLYTLTFDYGQRHAVEVEAAGGVATAVGARQHKVVRIDLRTFGGSALTDSLPVPVDRELDEIGAKIPVTYVPARNTIFLSFALAWAEVLQSSDIFIGVNACDYSGYPDCRPEYLRAYEAMASLATKEGVENLVHVKVHAPLISLTKAQIVQLGVELGVDYRSTISCYDPDEAGAACGRCDACLLRRKGFHEAGVPDPTRYRPILGAV